MIAVLSPCIIFSSRAVVRQLVPNQQVLVTVKPLDVDAAVDVELDAGTVGGAEVMMLSYHLLTFSLT